MKNKSPNLISSLVSHNSTKNKEKKMKTKDKFQSHCVWVSVTSLSVSSTAFAGSESHGGSATVCGSKVELAEFRETRM